MNKKLRAQASMTLDGRKGYKEFEGSALTRRGPWRTDDENGGFTESPLKVASTPETDSHHWTLLDSGRHPEGNCNYEYCEDHQNMIASGETEAGSWF